MHWVQTLVGFSIPSISINLNSYNSNILILLFLRTKETSPHFIYFESNFPFTLLVKVRDQESVTSHAPLAYTALSTTSRNKVLKCVNKLLPHKRVYDFFRKISKRDRDLHKMKKTFNQDDETTMTLVMAVMLWVMHTFDHNSKVLTSFLKIFSFRF